ncbi:MAG: hypothetical protein NT002_09305 [candidate division Zixibacteria bacterium]|nr:hypothetical protein [candidate division Zixibacteria bacterium]
MAMRRKAKPKAKKARRPVGKAWRGDELKKLRDGYKSRPASKIAKELGRSLASVRGKISALKLRKGPARKAKPKGKNLFRMSLLETRSAVAERVFCRLRTQPLPRKHIAGRLQEALSITG